MSSIYDDSVVESNTSDIKEEESTSSSSDVVSMDTKEDVAKPSPNTAIMFDWDDTLLASSFLASCGYRLDSVEPATPEVDAQLRALETCVCALINLALKYGHVNIVTNAETGWVQLSAQKFMPAVVPLLSKVTVISARSTFEAAHPDQPLKWKFFAFQQRLTAMFGSAPGATWGTSTSTKNVNVVSFGDSHVEREAIRAVTRGVSGCRTKSVKFAERPTPEQLRRQLELVTNCFHYIHNHDADLDLQLTVTLNPPSPSTSTSSSSSSTSTDASAPSSATPSLVPPVLPTTEVA